LSARSGETEIVLQLVRQLFVSSEFATDVSGQTADRPDLPWALEECGWHQGTTNDWSRSMTESVPGGLPAISVALPPSKSIVEWAGLAAQLGYRRVFVFDSPALYGDVWVALARIVESVPEIEVATGVAVSSLRHPMVTASAIATIDELAPGRVSAYFGTGFTARLAMGRRGVTWADLATYFQQVKALLRGEVVEVDDARCQMLHSSGFAPSRPIEVQLGLAPVGPKGFAIAQELADRVILASLPRSEQVAWNEVAMLTNGTVFDSGERHDSPRVVEALGPAYATGIHALHEWAPEVISDIPGGDAWRSRIESDRPVGERHLAVHEGHLVAVTDRDRPLLGVAGKALLDGRFSGSASEIASWLEVIGALGVTEVAYNPTGPDIARELQAFASVVHGSDR
jgi:5,10-methylenetetrahydromethanopterin reductase